MIQKHMTSNIDELSKLIDEYTNKHHSPIKFSPYVASKSKNAELVIQNLY